MSRLSNDMLLCIAVVCVCFNLCYGGTAVNFNAEPAVIVESLTKSVHMNCGVNDLSKRAWSTNATEEVDHVTQITVANNQGTIIAKVGEDQEVMVDHNKGGLTASGTVTGNAHLELTFANPSEMDMGVYKCSIIAISTTNRHMFLARTFNVKTRPATVPDVIGRLDQVEKENLKLKKCVSPYVGFMAALKDHSNHVSFNTNDKIVFDNELLDTSSSYDSSTGVFKCPVAGLYQFSLSVAVRHKNLADFQLVVNAKKIGTALAMDYADNWDTGSFSATVVLEQGDEARVVCAWPSTVNQDGYTVNMITFSGHLIRNRDCGL